MDENGHQSMAKFMDALVRPVSDESPTHIFVDIALLQVLSLERSSC